MIDLDVQRFFDTVPWELVVGAVEAVTDCRWVLLYLRRWLEAPLQHPDGTLVQRDKGTPPGSAISPVLANLFMHYAFDPWMAREFSGCPFERYADLCGCPHKSAYAGFLVMPSRRRDRCSCGGLGLKSSA